MKLTLKKVRDEFRKAEFNPNVVSDLTFAMDVDSIDYFEQQAILLIREAKDLRLTGETNKYNDKIVKAQQMLTIGKLYLKEQT